LFQVGPFELLVLAIVGLLVLGPERLPGFARQAAQMLRTLRDLATGAQRQLREELGPEFADVDLRNLNPRTVVRRAIFDEDFDFDDLDPRKKLRGAFVDDDMRAAADPRRWLDDDQPNSPVELSKPVSAPMPTSGLGVPRSAVNGSANGARPRPRPSPRPRYDDDVT
jgi:sec-independent protein translocase protein TatB